MSNLRELLWEDEKAVNKYRNVFIKLATREWYLNWHVFWLIYGWRCCIYLFYNWWYFSACFHVYNIKLLSVLRRLPTMHRMRISQNANGVWTENEPQLAWSVSRVPIPDVRQQFLWPMSPPSNKQNSLRETQDTHALVSSSDGGVPSCCFNLAERLIGLSARGASEICELSAWPDSSVHILIRRW